MIADRLRDLLAGGWFTDGLVAGMAAAFACGLIAGRRELTRAERIAIGAPVLLSLLAAGGAYACTPDTELARMLTGAVVGGGAVSVAAGLSWWWPSWLVSASLVVVAIHDGRPRASAVVGTLAIALLHVAGQLLLRAGGSPVAVLGVLAVAVAVCSRVAGLAASAGPAILVAGVTVLVALGALALLGPPLRSGRRRWG